MTTLVQKLATSELNGKCKTIRDADNATGGTVTGLPSTEHKVWLTVDGDDAYIIADGPASEVVTADGGGSSFVRSGVGVHVFDKGSATQVSAKAAGATGTTTVHVDCHGGTRT